MHTTKELQSMMTPDFFKGLVDFSAADSRVQNRLDSLKTGEELVRFFARYASWNGRFANGVSALVAMIGESRELFREKGYPRAVSDRSNYIASFIFDAARDEFDDHINPARDPHRSMAQAELICMNEFYKLGDSVLDEADPLQLNMVNDSVMKGYAGGASPSGLTARVVFAGMGYHLGSELLADREFSIIDKHLRATHANLVEHLLHSTVELTGDKHRCYAWIGVHSGEGGGVEADHFDFALSGVRAAFKYLVGNVGSTALLGLTEGFRAFERDHQRFFAIDHSAPS